MPRISPRAQGAAPPDIGSLRERVVICTTVERPDADVSTLVERPGVAAVHGSVRPMRGVQVLYWKSVFESPFAPTHEIVIRTPPDIHVGIGHWVFHEDRYAQTWYRVRLVEELGGVRRFLVLLCNVETVKDRRSDPATQPPPPRWETPERDEPIVESI